MTERVPVAVGGVGGSGTRLVARILSDAGLYLGDDLNRALDNLWFKLLFDRPGWLPGSLRAGGSGLAAPLATFRRAMTVGLADGRTTLTDRRVVARATLDMARHGHDVEGHGKGRWALERGRSILRSRGHDPGRSPGWGWKEPNSTMFALGPLRRHLGRVRYVHVMRHGLDAAFNRLQVYPTWAGMLGVAQEGLPGPVASLRFWLAANGRAVEVGERTYGEDFLVVRLEDLCARPREGVERLLAFAGVQSADDLLDRLSELPSLPPSAGRYRDEDLSIFEPADLDGLERLGYRVEAERPSARTARRRTSAQRISIAMCTYDGERFLPEQLDSILAQTRPPDDMVVCDDASTDGTVKLLEDFATVAPFPVRVIRNEENLGSTKNFERVIGLAEGDLVFLADQDDVWHAGKLAAVEQAFRDDPDLCAVFTDADLIDERSRSTGHGLWDTIGFTRPLRRRVAEGDAMPVLVQGNVATGAALAFRSTYRDLLLPIPREWVQDAWVVILLAAVGRILPLDEPLIRYRIHAAQQIGVTSPPKKTRLDLAVRKVQFRRKLTKQERPAMSEFAEYFGFVVDRLRACADRFPVAHGAIDDLEGKVRHLRLRAGMWTTPNRWRVVGRELVAGGYRRYSNGVASAAKDLFLLDRMTAAGRSGGMSGEDGEG